jgi:hypothetical protein
VGLFIATVSTEDAASAHRSGWATADLAMAVFWIVLGILALAVAGVKVEVVP